MSDGLDPVISARSAQRRLVSLARANEIRVERANLKRALGAGSVMFAEVLANPPACALTAKVGDLLLAVPGIGPAKTARALSHCRIANTKTIGGLSDRQRAALTDRLLTKGLGAGNSTSANPRE
jgi:S13-like protein